MLSRSPVTDCNACPFGLSSRGRCRFSPATREVGATLCAQGEVPVTAFFLKEGFISLSAVSQRGAETSLALRGPGALVCSESVRGAPSPHEVRALSRVRLCAISGGSLGAWVGPGQGPSAAVIELLLSEIASQHDDAAFREGDCLSRVARFTLAHGSFLAERPAAVRKGTLARLLGMRAETLSRCLGRLERDGLLDATRGLAVKDEAGLAALARGPQEEAEE